MVKAMTLEEAAKAYKDAKLALDAAYAHRRDLCDTVRMMDKTVSDAELRLNEAQDSLMAIANGETA